MRLADVDAEIFGTPTSKDCFVQERTVTKNEAMSESRDEAVIGRFQCSQNVYPPAQVDAQQGLRGLEYLSDIADLER